MFAIYITMTSHFYTGLHTYIIPTSTKPKLSFFSLMPCSIFVTAYGFVAMVLNILVSYHSKHTQNCSNWTRCLKQVSVSAPIWNDISFLNVGPTGSDQIRYGVFGYTHSRITLGYLFNLDSVNDKATLYTTKWLILHPIGM